MSFSDYESSHYLGMPVELMDIIYGETDTDVIHLTTADHVLTVGGFDYQPGYMERDSITGDGNPYDSEQITFKLARGNPFEAIWVEQNFVKLVMIRVREMHLNDVLQNTRMVWNGRSMGVSLETSTMNLGSERLSTYMKYGALTMKYQVGQCVNILWRGLCLLNKADFEVTGFITSVNANDVIIPEAAAFADGYFLGGILTVNGINRWVVGHVGSTIIVDRTAAVLVHAAAASLYPGCNRLKTTCDDKFDNGINYLAFDEMPNSGPFDGASLN